MNSQGKRYLEENDFETEGDEDIRVASKKTRSSGHHCNTYLETVDKRKLDFDFEKICSVTLSNINVYCCLVCGKYLQGRGNNSAAFLHSVNDNHHVFINFDTLKVYILPDNYEAKNVQFLKSIKYAIRPTYNEQDIKSFPQQCYDLNNRKYLNGFIGLNNISNNDYANVVIQLLGHVSPIRDYFLLKGLERNPESQLIRRLSIIVRKMWSPKLFKPHISPHELLQYISLVSKQKFSTKESKDPRNFILWLLTELLSSSNDTEVKKLLAKQFQGKVETIDTKVRSINDSEGKTIKFVKEEQSSISRVVKFWYLSLDLPPSPLFKDGRDVNNLPQVKLEKLLEKFNNVQESHLSNSVRKYKILKLPPYLMLHINRFEANLELKIKNRNQTVVELPQIMELNGAKYKLISNVVHEAAKVDNNNDNIEVDDKSEWKIQLNDARSNQWFEIKNIDVKPKEEEFLFLSESYLQIWEKIH